MPIRMLPTPWSDKAFGWKGGGLVPRFVCDVCGTAIEDAMEGNAVWEVSGASSVSESNVIYVHKDSCDREATEHARARGSSTMWIDLLEFPVLLANNSTPASRHPENGPIVQLSPLHPRYGTDE